VSTIYPLGGTVTAEGHRPTCRQGIAIHASRVNLSAMQVVVHGEIDAANAGDLADRVQPTVAGCHELVLDLTSVDFLGVEGFSALKQVQSWCHRNGVRWVLVPSAAVARVMRLCDRDRSVPTAATSEAAIHALRASASRADTGYVSSSPRPRCATSKIW
jgi:anti-anti-sigma factor